MTQSSEALYIIVLVHGSTIMGVIKLVGTPEVPQKTLLEKSHTLFKTIIITM